MIARILEQNEIELSDEVIMVGDRKFDVVGAKANQISVVGVLYDFGGVSAQGDRLRAECFSACNSVYVRFRLPVCTSCQP